MEQCNNEEKLIEEAKSLCWVWQELSVLALSVAIGIMAYRFNNVLGDSVGLFGRSGSIIVLLAVVNEYRLRTLRDRQLAYFESRSVRNSPDEIRKILRPQVFLGQKVVTVLTHIQIVVGTVIWGFGDLVV